MWGSTAFDFHVQESRLYGGQHAGLLICVDFTVPHVLAARALEESLRVTEKPPR